MLIPIMFFIIIGIVIIVTIISTFSMHQSGGNQRHHLRHRIYEDAVAKPKHDAPQTQMINQKREAVQQDDYDDFFKEYDDFFEQDDDPFNTKK